MISSLTQFGRLDSRPEAELAEAQLSSGIDTPLGPVSYYRKPGGEIGIVIPLTSTESTGFSPDVQSQAIKLTRLNVDGNRHVRLSLHAPMHRETFCIFVDEVLEEISRNPSMAASTAASMLQRWRQFFSMVRDTGLSGEKEIGLLCELELLHQLLSDGVHDAVQRWKGPEKGRRDFLLKGGAVECKATLQTSGLTVTIHGADQLESSSKEPLTLVVKRYEVHPDGLLSVPGMVTAICSLPNTPVEMLMSKLAHLGVSLAQDPGVEVFRRYNPRGHYEFDVTQDFPRLNPVGLADRIQNVRYSLDLADPESVPGFRPHPKYLPSTSNQTEK